MADDTIDRNNRRGPLADNHAALGRSISSGSHLTPQSLPFNFSQQQQQHHQQPQRRRTPGGSSPSSTLLQDLLREKKAQSHRVSKAYNGRRRSGRDDGLLDLEDTEATNRRLVQSSPLGHLRAGEVRDPKEGSSRRASAIGSKGSAGARGMGAREIDEFISTLHKQNFDLKLELYHRRQRMTELEEQLEQAKELEKENEELQEVNEQLLQELEKRDRAVEEAVGIICELEEKVERLEEELATETRPSTAQPDTDYFTTEADESVPSSSPPGTGNREAPATPPPAKMLRKTPSKPGMIKTASSRLIDISTPHRPNVPASAYRTPSFLTGEDSKSAGALRSLYLAGENEGRSTYSFLTLSRRASGVSRDAPGSPDPNGDGMDSPRLSVLSESSFLSVYGDTRRLDLDISDEPTRDENEDGKEDSRRGETEDNGRPSSKQIKAARIEKWMDDRATPSKPSRASYGNGSKGQFLSIGDVLHNRSHLVDDENFSRGSPRREGPVFFTRDEKQRKENTQPMNMTGGTIFFGRDPQTQTQTGTPTFFTHEDRQKKENIEPMNMMGGPIFGQDLLPPTPDTMSTFDRDSYNQPASSIVREKSLLDGTPAPARSYSALIPQPRPRSANGVRNGDITLQSWETDIDFNDLASSDGELGSLRVEHSEWDQENDQVDISRLPFFSIMSPASMRHLDRGTPSKTNPGTYERDLLLAVDALDGSSTGLNGPPNDRSTRQGSPTHDARKRSFQHSTPRDRLRSGLSRMETAPASSPPVSSPWTAESSDTATPTRYGYSNSPRSPSTPWRDTTTLPIASSRIPSDSKLPRSNLRLCVPKVSLTPSPTKRNSLTSRIFGRGGTQSETNSPNIETPPTNAALHSLFSRTNRPLNFQPSPPRRPRPGTAGSVEGKGGNIDSPGDGGLRNKSSASTWESESGGEDAMTPKTETEEFGHGTMGKGNSRSYEDLGGRENEEQEMMSRSLQLERSNTVREGRPTTHVRTYSMITERTTSSSPGGDLDKKDEAPASKRGWLGSGRLGGLRPASVATKGVKEVKGRPGQKLSALRKDREDAGRGLGVTG
ncbi:hypothetical protein FGG08_005956 [Glutinoglossum americanum]|uniref:Centrosomin N-terminal motif 1 domain-containing protein n=1 Tax=Glutinoglossum americanum TaxID=1670608 RepID=A0A9P8L0Y0_9PEZI|nr:hypothetical protein FGG08_005956 [Glutinoglossum americanum]